MFVQAHSLQLALQKWEPAGRICDFGIFFNGLAKSPRVVRSSWILNECNFCYKIVQYCILSEVCVLKTVTPSTVSPQMWCINGIKGWFYTQPDLLARFCKVNLSNAKKFDRLFKRHLRYVIRHWDHLHGGAYCAEHALPSSEELPIQITHLSPGSSSAKRIDCSIRHSTTPTWRALWLR